MNKISINHNTIKVDERALEHGSLTIGRNADNDIQLDDPSISGHHAKLVTIFNASHVEDLGSTNGTFVNSKLVTEHTLHSGDVISLGEFQIVFYSDKRNTKSASEETIVMDSSQLDSMLAEADKKRNMPVGQQPVMPKPSMPQKSSDNNEHDQVKRPNSENQYENNAEAKVVEFPVIERRSNPRQTLHDSMREESSSTQGNRLFYVFAGITATVLLLLIIFIIIS